MASVVACNARARGQYTVSYKVLHHVYLPSDPEGRLFVQEGRSHQNLLPPEPDRNPRHTYVPRDSDKTLSTKVIVVSLVKYKCPSSVKGFLGLRHLGW